MSLVGQRSGVQWRMGQKLEVALSEVHLGRLEIRLMPLELPKGIGGRGKRGGRVSRTSARKGSTAGWKLVSPGDGRGTGAKPGKAARNGKKNSAGKSTRPGKPSTGKPGKRAGTAGKPGKSTGRGTGKRG